MSGLLSESVLLAPFTLTLISNFEKCLANTLSFSYRVASGLGRRYTMFSSVCFLLVCTSKYSCIGCVASSSVASILGNSSKSCSFFLYSSCAAYLSFSASASFTLRSLRSCNVFSIKANELEKSSFSSEIPLLKFASLVYPSLWSPRSLAFITTLSNSGVLNSWQA